MVLLAFLDPLDSSIPPIKFEGALSVMIIVVGNESVTWVQILHGAVSVSLYPNALRKSEIHLFSL